MMDNLDISSKSGGGKEKEKGHMNTKKKGEETKKEKKKKKKFSKKPTTRDNNAIIDDKASVNRHTDAGSISSSRSTPSKIMGRIFGWASTKTTTSKEGGNNNRDGGKQRRGDNAAKKPSHGIDADGNDDDAGSDDGYDSFVDDNDEDYYGVSSIGKRHHHRHRNNGVITPSSSAEEDGIPSSLPPPPPDDDVLAAPPSLVRYSSSSSTRTLSDISGSTIRTRQPSPRRRGSNLLSITEDDVLHMMSPNGPNTTTGGGGTDGAPLDGHGHHRKRRVSLKDDNNDNSNLEDNGFQQLSTLPLRDHEEMGLTDVESSSVCGSIMTSYSDMRPVASSGLYRRQRNNSNEVSPTRESDGPGDDGDDDDIVMRITNLPWTHEKTDDDDDNTGDDDPPIKERIHGRYTGPIDDEFKPHGGGRLTIRTENGSIKFYGRWENGKLISTLSAEPPPQGQRGSEIVESAAEEKKGRTINGYTHNPAHTHGSSSSNNNNSTHNVNTDVKYIINKNRKLISKHQHSSSPMRYNIGEGCRTPVDMLVHRSTKKAVECVSQLRKWDQAFVKRSNGTWTVAVLIDRALQPKNGVSRGNGDRTAVRWRSVWEIDRRSTELEESMLFVIDDDGATKIVNRNSWGKYVRRMKV